MESSPYRQARASDARTHADRRSSADLLQFARFWLCSKLYKRADNETDIVQLKRDQFHLFVGSASSMQLTGTTHPVFVD